MTRMRAHCFSTASCFLIAVLCLCINMRLINGRDSIKTHLDEEEATSNYDVNSKGTKWAVLVAGSRDYYNYRHQADVCHAYQLLKKGGLKDENIIVFVYDDIAYNEDNPRPGVIINKPKGKDVYKGVPKDYTGEEVTVENLSAVLLGNRSAVKGGSGKVVDSGPNDHIFVYYTDHGGPGVLAMPSDDDLLYADKLIEVLKEKHSSGTYKKMVIYVEACESGSIFEGLLPEDMNIYATTASNAVENSFATYCPGDYPNPAPEEYQTCLGDLYSVAWLEDSDKHSRRAETLKKQYHRIKNRTAPIDHDGSHVMRYGDLKMGKEKLAMFMGSNTDDDGVITDEMSSSLSSSFSRVVNQRDADIVYFWEKFIRAPEGSTKKLEAQKQLAEIIQHRVHIDKSIKQIGELLFDDQNAILNTVRPSGQPLVDDWDCLRSMVKTFETHCGSLSTYGLKHMRAIANICNNAAASAATDDDIGVDLEKKMTEVTKTACPSFPTNPWSSLKKRSVT